MRKRWALVYACVLLLGACTSARRDYANVLATDVAGRTVGPGDTAPPLPAPTRSETSLIFTWDFETHMNPQTYGAWLKTRLGDFQLVVAGDSGLRFARQVDGDAYRLHVTLQSDPAGTRVHAVLTASPD
jgi:hypothetical protein